MKKYAPEDSPGCRAQEGAPRPASTAAVFVLYHPDARMIDCVRRVLAQVEQVVIVANDNEPAERLGELDSARICYIRNARNIGLAAALNQGITAVRRAGFDWCLLLDQDTVVDDDLISGLHELYCACPFRDRVGMLAPNYRNSDHGKAAYPTEPKFQLVPTVVTSGSLLSMRAVSQIGLMHEPLFLEGIDLEYALRMRAGGFEIIATGRPLMTHGAGECESHRLLGGTVLVSHHPPWRYYLQFRNLTWVLLHRGRTDPKWSATTLVAIGKKLVLLALFEKQRGRKMIRIIEGILHGLSGSLGVPKSIREHTRRGARFN